jgi:hypothetical protein
MGLRRNDFAGTRFAAQSTKPSRRSKHEPSNRCADLDFWCIRRFFGDRSRILRDRLAWDGESSFRMMFSDRELA